jgi:histidinol-phosphate aminotransferase
MNASRRGFVRTAGLTAAAFSGTALAARGFEAAVAAAALGQPMPEMPAGAIRISSNENPYGPGPHVVSAVEQALRDGNRYARAPMLLATAVASVQGVPADAVLMAAGSGDLLRAAVLAFTSAERPLVTAVPSYEGPVRMAEALKVPVRGVPVTAGFGLDLPAMVGKAPGAGLVFICNPNNPTGTFLSKAAVTGAIGAIAQASPSTITLIDEAYFDCADDATYGSVASLAATTPNVLVLRTFSKIHGLAGMRIGYAIGHPDTIRTLRLYAGQSVLSGVSSAAALASLKDSAYYAQQQALNRDGRAWTTKALTEMGYAPVASQANFVLVDVRRDVRTFQQACREKGVLVARPFPPLMTHARISIGTPDEMRRAIGAIREVLVAPTSAAR